MVWELGFGQNLGWELGFGQNLGWEMGFGFPPPPPLQVPQSTTRPEATVHTLTISNLAGNWNT